MNPVGRLALLLPLALGACDRPRHGEIVGDAYLVIGMEREVDLAGVPVHLVAELEDDEETPRVEHLDTILANICVQRERYIAQAKEQVGGDSLATLVRDAYSRAWRARDRLMADAVRRTVRTRPRAEFFIDSIEPGRYRLWADTVIDAEHWSWLRPVVIEAGDSLRVNLSNANVDENPFRCRAPD